MVGSAIAKKGEVRGEIDRIQVASRVGQHRLFQARFVEGADFDALRDEVVDMRDQPLGVEGQHQCAARLGIRQRRHRLRELAEHRHTDGV